MISTLIHRAWKIGITFKNSVKNIDIIKRQLIKHGYEENHMEKITSNTIDKYYIKEEQKKE